MYINNLYLENFRNYKRESFDFCKGTNVIYGLNGQGKTNVIEALYYFSGGKSYRTSREKEIINFDSNFSKAKINFFDEKRDNTFEIFFQEKKSVKINDIPIYKLSEMIGVLNMVIFTPDMLNIIKGGPGIRRQFIDIMMSQIKPYYFKTLINYYKVLMQRNNILKRHDKNMYSTIDIWNEKAAEYGTVVCRYRQEAAELINKYVNQTDFKEGEKIKIEYNPEIKGDCTDKSNFINQLENNFERDSEKGISMIGPHRDDYDIFINDKSIKKYGSQGQIRTCVMNLKLSECEIIKNILQRQPILLLDDILSELDERRKDFFLNNIKEKQVFITCTEKEKINKKNECMYFHISEGKIIR